MPELNIEKAVVTDNTREDFSVATASTDAAFEQKETTYTNSEYPQQLGYFFTIPELKKTIKAKASWTVGKGYDADEVTTMLLDTIKGIGKDTFNSIMENAVRVKHIGGDSFTHIIRDDDGVLINLKPLDPAVMVTIVNKQGLIIRYEQNSKVKGQPPKKFKPEDVFHLMRDRVADEIHGRGVPEEVEDIILMRNEAMTDYKRVMHRNIDPLWIIHADTDDTTKIASIKTDWENVRKKGETWIVPKGVVVPELVSVSPNATLNPLAWIESLNDYFYEAVGVPKIIVGNSKNFTDASSKISYLAFEQNIKGDQLELEEQILSQLNLVLKYRFPASLESDLLSGEAKAGPEAAAEPNDTTAEMEGKK